MITIPPAKFRPWHRKRKPRSMVDSLALVAAIYEEDAWVRLTFDRAIDVSAIDASQVHVNDNPGTGWFYTGNGSINQVNATTVQIELAQDGAAMEPETFLVASASTGIVAVDDGAQWAGTSGTALPFP